MGLQQCRHLEISKIDLKTSIVIHGYTVDTFFRDLNEYMICFLQMDDNLRKSPQHPPQKLTTLKLSSAGEGNSSLNRLSP